MPKLTKSAIDKASAGDVIRDSDVPGFHCKAGRTKKTFYLHFRLHGRERRPAIGVYGALTVEQARNIAREWRFDISRGIDPTDARKASASPTMAEIADRYQIEHANMNKTEYSAGEDRRRWNKHILPKIGTIQVDKVTRRDVQAVIDSMRHIPQSANLALSLLSKTFNLAERWYLRTEGTNPCRHVDRYPSVKRRRYLSRTEAASLGEALDFAERMGGNLAKIADLVRVLIFTGARLSEIKNSRRDQYDLAAGKLFLADHKTAKQTGIKTIHLPPPAVKIIARHLDSHEFGYVFGGLQKPDQPIKGYWLSWKWIRDRAGLVDFRPHDLRHSFASVAVSSGETLEVIGSLLGHTTPQTTARYAHLTDAPQRAAAAATAGTLVAWLAEPANRDPDQPES